MRDLRTFLHSSDKTGASDPDLQAVFALLGGR